MTPMVRRVPDLVYGEVPGYRPLELDLYLPEAAAPVPVIVHVHGGGWWRGSRRVPLPVPGYRAWSPGSRSPTWPACWTTWRLAEALTRAGAMVELELVPGATHFWNGADDVAAIVRRSAGFLDALKGKD